MDGLYYAKELLKAGVPTIPLSANKTPTIKFANATIDVAFIDSNAESYESASGLGVLTRKWWCIDVDRNHADGVDGFESIKTTPFIDEIAEIASQTMRQETPSGGLHLIFEKRKGVTYSQKIGYLPGVDIKANDNNYFVLAGSKSHSGEYTSNDKLPIPYAGEFEGRIFGSPGNYREQIMNKYSVKQSLSSYDFSHLPMPKGKGGRGKQAYERIINGTSEDRNNDLFLAVSYAKACNVEIEPLRAIIGTVKGRDVFTESEFNKTAESALKG